MEEKNLLEDLIRFIREEIREFNQPIEKETLIEHDLGVTGDDASEMILAFSKRYDVDITNFHFPKYFNDEPVIFSFGRKITPLAVGHLAKAIREGRLDEEVING